MVNGFFKFPINPYGFCVSSTSTFFWDKRYFSIISFTLSDIGSDDGNFLPTLDVSLVIASLDTKFKVKISFSASISTFVIDAT